MTAESAADNSDQSMEEILQSIKRIIADEDDDVPAEDVMKAEKPEPEVEPKKVVDDKPASEILELTEMVQEDGTTVDLKEEVKAEKPEPAPKPAKVVSSDPFEDLMSQEAAAASAASLAALANKAKPAPEPFVPLESPVFRYGNTVEDLVLEALRPMLKEWIDHNLPQMVERMVEREIKKISGQ